METFLSLMKETCLVVAENTLATTLLAVGVAIVIWLLLTIIYGSKVARWRGTANDETLARTKLNAQLENAEQRVLQLQNELNSQNDRITQLETDKQGEAERASTLSQQLEHYAHQLNHSMQRLAVALTETLAETEMNDVAVLWQQHDALVARILDNLAVQQAHYVESQQAIANATTQLTEQNAVIENLQQALAAQTARNSQLAEELEQQGTMVLVEQQTNLARLAELEQQVEQVAAVLNATQQQLEQTETRLQLTISQLAQAEQAKHTIQQQVEQQTSQFDAQLQQAEHTLKMQLRDKEILIDNLNATIIGHENHLARLQQRLEAKVLPETNTSPAQATTTVQANIKAEAVAPNAETKTIAVNNSITAIAEHEWQQLSAKFKELPVQLQSLYSKTLNSFKK